MQGILLRGLHGSREEHWESLCPEVSQEETPRSQQPGKRNPCPEEVRRIKAHSLLLLRVFGYSERLLEVL